MKLSGRDIVCVGFADWDSELRTNQHHLMSRLARENRVLFVESLGLRQPQLSSKDLRRIVRRLKRGLSPPREVDGLYVLSPLVIPLHRYGVVRALNRRILPWLVGRTARKLGMSAPLLWSYNPQAEVLIDVLRPSQVIYHCVDDVAVQKGVDAESFRAAERRFAERADLVFATSEPLASRLREFVPGALTMPNVADTELFAQALEDGPVDTAVAALPEPRIVFTGAIVATKLDVQLLLDLARSRRDWSFALVGPIGAGDPSTDVSPLAAEPNIHLLGLRRYEQLPQVLRGADAALIPYSLNELTRSIFPMKVYEYLAAGLPVVSTPLPSLEGVEGLVSANDAPATAAAIERLLAEDGPEARAERTRIAGGHSWDARIDEIAEALNGHG